MSNYDKVMDTLAASPPLFGPPILPVATMPADRPSAVALVLDISSSMYGDRRIFDLFKEHLVARFANMEYDNILYLAGQWYEDPGSAVAAIHGFVRPVRNFSASISEAVKDISTIDRIYRRSVLLVTDQFSVRDVQPMNTAVERASMRLLDIVFQAIAYGPIYARVISECGWNFHHLDEPEEIDPILTEVCK